MTSEDPMMRLADYAGELMRRSHAAMLTALNSLDLTPEQAEKFFEVFALEIDATMPEVNAS